MHIDGRVLFSIQLFHPASPPTKDIAELDRALKIFKHMRYLVRKIDLKVWDCLFVKGCE